MYRLDNSFLSGNRGIALVGCGGTGSFLADGLCRLFRGTGTRIVLVDGDRVEERNLLRQNFYPEDLGRFKSQALAERLAMKFRMPVGYSVNPLVNPLEQKWNRQMLALEPGILVGCVDNAHARAAMAEWCQCWHTGWWVDAGNGDEFGQVLVGNAPREKLAGAFLEDRGICWRLPRPTDQRHELLMPRPDELQGPNCAAAVAAGAQSPTINQAMAALTLEVVRRIVAGACTWMQLSLDLAAGTMQAVHATPEAVSQMCDMDVHQLVTNIKGRR